MSTLSVNPVTKNKVQITAGKLLKIPDVAPFTNKSTGKQSRILHIEVADKHGVLRTIVAFINMANFNYGIKVGETYRTVIEKVPGRVNPWVTMSHLTAADSATNDMWDWEENSAEGMPSDAELQSIRQVVEG